MRFPEKVTHDVYETIARRSLRLFLSVDIVDSTALKQEYRDRDDSWIEIAHTFFTGFPNLLSEAFTLIGFWERRTSGSGLELWKAIGDELVFVAEIDEMSDVPLLVEGFRDAVNQWNMQFEKTGVSVKATGWLAGFPVMNSVIPGDSTTGFDYLGTSIDIGFRLCGFASPRKFILGIELAYVLSILGEKLDKTFRYLGKKTLKGVLRNRAYPVFWIDCFDLDIRETIEPGFAELDRLEDALTGEHQSSFSRNQMKTFSSAWIDSTRGDILLPFCPTQSDPQFPIPDDYEAKRESALAELEREFLEEGSIDLDDGNDDDLEDFRDSVDKL